MKKATGIGVITLVCVLCSYFVLAQEPRTQMTFFVTSVGMGDGGNLGGLAGADKHCSMLAQAVGSPATKVWHAYLSTQASGNEPAVNARDRIGKGPWFNADGADLGARNIVELHGETGQGSPMNRTVALNENGKLLQSTERKGDTHGRPENHDILTGSKTDGRAFTDGMDHTCNNWTSNSTGAAQVGHHDRNGGGGGGGDGEDGGGGGGRGGGASKDRGTTSWNSSHASNGCSQASLAETNGAGFFYCFAIN